ncbi:MAG: hypothetical protein K5981_09435 [Clostridia bacterium]|nr:hypothetical protein [Clostridia bacterium]
MLKNMPKSLKICLKVLGVLLGLFTGTFLIYIFNLDMKLTAKIEPLLLKHYDRIPRDRHL